MINFGSKVFDLLQRAHRMFLELCILELCKWGKTRMVGGASSKRDQMGIMRET